MGTLKITRHTISTENYLSNALNYAMHKDTIRYGGIYVTPENAYNEMMYVKNYFHKTSGNQLIHFIVTLNETVYNENYAMELAYKIARYYAHCYQTIYGLHEKTMSNNNHAKSYYHIHIVINSVSYVDGSMFADNKADINQFKEYISKVTRDNHIQVIY